MERLYNLAAGTARLEISGAEPEKVLNYCAQKGIEFWDTSPKTDFTVFATIHAKDYPALKSISGKNGCDIRLLSTRGGKKLTKMAKRRYMIAVGFALCVTVLALSSLFIWKIDVTGNDTMSDAEVLRALSDCGVEYGAFWPTISSDAVRSELMLKLDNIAWLSVNVHNSSAEIVIHERIEKPEIVNEAEPCDITASKTGIITKMSVLEGNALASVGDTVVKGDTLVSGIMDSETADPRPVHAMAVIEARTWYELNARTPLYEAYKCDSCGTDRDFHLVFGKNIIKFGSDSRNDSQSCDKINKLRYASLGSAFVLPVGIITERTKVYETEQRQIDVTGATERLKDTLLDELKRQINGGSIVNTEFSISDDGDLLTVTLRAECVENIAKEK